MAPKFAAHTDAIRLNGPLFARIEALYNDREKSGLDAESKWLLERYYKDFVRAGAKLSEPDKTRLKALNADRSVLVATQGLDRNLFQAGRNISKLIIKPAAEVNAYDVLSKRTMIITKAAFEDVLKGSKPSSVKTAKANG